jgi:hypothetical protein
MVIMYDYGKPHYSQPLKLSEAFTDAAAQVMFSSSPTLPLPGETSQTNVGPSKMALDRCLHGLLSNSILLDFVKSYQIPRSEAM